ncbi:MAG: hypothetical protein OXI43_23225 [Candidatus Poribacteria bacterium]|nr:hypothetical protein [Candidatus Poribacteria bacterium]
MDNITDQSTDIEFPVVKKAIRNLINDIKNREADIEYKTSYIKDLEHALKEVKDHYDKKV